MNMSETRRRTNRISNPQTITERGDGDGAAGVIHQLVGSDQLMVYTIS